MVQFCNKLKTTLFFRVKVMSLYMKKTWTLLEYAITVDIPIIHVYFDIFKQYNYDTKLFYHVFIYSLCTVQVKMVDLIPLSILYQSTMGF